jgi:hypothetical protein
VSLTEGNVKNYHFYLRTCSKIIPDGGLGGKNAGESGTPFTVRFEPGMTVETDVDGSKMILRNRKAVRDFFERSAASAGDVVVIERTEDRALSIRLETSGGR